MSERNFLRRFKIEMGITPSDYLLQARLAVTCSLLTDSELPVDKIARRSGMGNGDRLAKIFRKRMMISPTEFRMQSRSEGRGLATRANRHEVSRNNDLRKAGIRASTRTSGPLRALADARQLSTASSCSALVPVVLAGGSGTRLWPMSREQYPKQLIDVVGSDSLLQATVRRWTAFPIGWECGRCRRSSSAATSTASSIAEQCAQAAWPRAHRRAGAAGHGARVDAGCGARLRERRGRDTRGDAGRSLDRRCSGACRPRIELAAQVRRTRRDRDAGRAADAPGYGLRLYPHRRSVR